MEEKDTENTLNPGRNGFQPKSEEEMAKDRKNRKRELIAGAIGDLGSAFANLFFTTKGAPSIINSTGKNRQPTLMERISSRHKEEDNAYGKQLSAWDKEQKRLEKERKANERQNDIHPDFRPLKSNWNSDDFMSYIYDDFRAELNHRKNYSTLHQIENQINNASSRSRPYLMQDLIQHALDGVHDFYSDESKKELDEDFISMLRKRWTDLDSEWEKMK